MSDTLVLSPAEGDAVAVPRRGWEATCDLLGEAGAFSDEELARLRLGRGTIVGPDVARRIAWYVDDELHKHEHPADDAAGLTRLRDFCLRSNGFGVERQADPPAPLEQVAAAPPAWHAKARRVLGPFAIVLIFIAKWAVKLKALVFLLPKLKYLSTAASGLVSIGFYALFWGWRFAAVFVGLLFIHELGHVIALRREGIPATAPMFIPFLGAMVGMREMPKNAWVEAKVALAGPLLGSLGALGVYELGSHEHSQLLIAAAYTGFLLNLFNLAPITPLDGGRAAAALHPAVWLLGIGALAFLFFKYPNGILGLILVIGGLDAFRRLRAWREGGPEAREYYRVKAWQRLAVALVFFGLAAALVIAMHHTHVPRPS